MSITPKYSAVIFDLGDVLFSWSSTTKTSISPKTLRRILSSPTWFDYERGRLSQDDCYERVGKEFALEPSEIEKAFDQARDSLKSNTELISVIRELKSQTQDQLRVFAMSNISLPDYEVLRTKPADWSIFDQVFTSGGAGERKPNLGFYRHVLAQTNVDPQTTIFVDDKQENVLSARSLGLHGIVFDSSDNVIRALRNLLGDPVKRGQAFLQDHAGRLESVTDSGIVLQENFAQLLILEATKDRDLVNLVEQPRTWNFFHGKPLLTTEEFPFDLDTTSLGLTVTARDEEVAGSVMNEMLEYIDGDGIIQTYFDHQRPRFDPVVCVNALSLFYSYGRGSELPQTLQWVYEVLLHRAYLDGTRYYATPECFLFFLCRLLESTDSPDIHDSLKPLLKERVEERIGADGDGLALAMRIVTCACVGIRDEVDLRTLLPLQCEDGGWEMGWIYKYGSSGIKIGNRGLTTALAIKAIQAIAEPTLSRRPSTPTSSRSDTPETLIDSAVTPVGKRRRRTDAYRRAFRRSMSWLWHGGKLGKPIDAVF